MNRKPMDRVGRLLREPLLHFLLIGMALFAAYGMLQQPGDGEPGEIVVTQGQIEHLAAAFARTWQRPPTPAELAGLVRDRVREEVYYREAIAMGLDRDDTVIRRRLRQKMEFISDDIAAQREPTEAELRAYLQAHPETFRVEPRYSFTQVYLNPQRHRDLADDAARLLARLNEPAADTDPAALGDALMLETQFEAMPASDVASLFGAPFAAALAGLAPGQWQGPVASGYGVHLVRVSERTAGDLPALADVRAQVLREWTNARRMEANEQFYQGLLKRYIVTVEGPEATAESDDLALNKAP